jgi:hypothetical protein
MPKTPCDVEIERRLQGGGSLIGEERVEDEVGGGRGGL